MPPIRVRADLGDVLKQIGAKKGVELGVQAGEFFESVAQKWQIADLYVLVDIWATQNNYADAANKDIKEQLQLMNLAISVGDKMKRNGYVKEVELCRNFTSECVNNYPDGYFDFIYVDARHDYKGVRMDIEMWWPKLKEGGIMAGHDYLTQFDLSGIYTASFVIVIKDCEWQEMILIRILAGTTL